MRILIVAVGRIGSGPENTLCEDYLKRARPLLRGFGVAGLEQVELRESTRPDAAARMEEEAARVLAKIPAGARLVVLDEGGETIGSRAFADMLKPGAGTADIAFVIGGPDGLAGELRKAAARSIAFGAMTMPHRLVRAILAEQIYRAATILAGHPYHRE
ncbi:MAG: 23S rRNA (pseudouridine(1915)-N(3))-methyltransferase RlmH [Flavobacteriaceae bacterium]